MIDERVRRPLLADAIFSRLMDGLTGGPFLAGVALAVGATTPQIAMLAALPFLAQVVQLPTVALLLKFHDRRRIVVAAAGASRALYLVLAALLLWWGAFGPSELIWLIAISTVLAVVATGAWNWWMRDLLPPDEISNFFGHRLRGATLVSIVAMLAAGFGLDAYIAGGDSVTGYGLLFAFGGVVGILGVWSLAITPHVAPPPSPPARESLAVIWRAFRHASPRLLAGLSLVSIATSFALPFAAVFMLRALGYSLVLVTAMAMLSQLAYLAGLRGWVHVSNRHGDRPVLAMSLGVLAAALVGWGAAGWGEGRGLLALVAAVHFLAGYAMSGIELGTNNLLLRTAPADNAAAHMAAVSVFRAAAGGFGVLLAGILWSDIGYGPLWDSSAPWLGGWTLRGFQVLALLSLVPCLWGIYAVARMRLPDQPRIGEVARTVRREVSQMSSIAGIRAFIHAVSFSVEFLAAPFAARERRLAPRKRP